MKYDLSKLIRMHILFVILIIFTSLFCLSTTRIGSDEGWHLFVAGKMLEGKKLYHDFYEVNLPMIFYITLLPSFFSKVSNISDILIFKAFNFALGIFVFFFSLRLLSKQYKEYETAIISPYLAVLIFILPFCFPVSEFGQKEYLFTILVLPYLLVSLTLKNYSNTERLIAALLAGIGFGIKPFFVIWFIITELFYYFKKHKIFRIENLVILLILICYYLYFLIFENAYFYTVLPVALNSYKFLLYTDNYFLFFINQVILTSNFALVGLPLLLLLDKSKKLFLTALILSVGIIIYIQKQFFWYHFIPLIALLYLVAGFVIIQEFNQNGNFKNFKILFMLVVFILGSLLTAFDYYLGINKTTIPLEKVQNEFNKLNSKDIFIITTKAQYVFPIVNYLKINWPAKEHWMQVLEGVLRRKFVQGYLDKNAENYVVQDIINAIKHCEYLIIHNPKDKIHNNYMIFYYYGNYVTYLSQYTAFDKEFAKFRYLKDIEHDLDKLTIYKREEN